MKINSFVVEPATGIPGYLGDVRTANLSITWEVYKNGNHITFKCYVTDSYERYEDGDYTCNMTSVSPDAMETAIISVIAHDRYLLSLARGIRFETVWHLVAWDSFDNVVEEYYGEYFKAKKRKEGLERNRYFVSLQSEEVEL